MNGSVHKLSRFIHSRGHTYAQSLHTLVHKCGR